MSGYSRGELKSHARYKERQASDRTPRNLRIDVAVVLLTTFDQD